MARKAVLIGCNYPFTRGELKGCVNDVKRMHKCLVERYDFSDEDITVLIDTDRKYTEPTGLNVRTALADLVNPAQPGDFLFVHYSGHGTRLPTPEDDDTGYDECIVPTDLNLITDNDIRKLVDKVPEGCQITIVSDSCHSGGLIDEAKEQIGKSTYQRKMIEEEKEEGEGEIDSRGIHIPHHEDDEAYFKDKYLPLSTLIELLQQKTGKEDIDVGKLRSTLFDIFGDDASPTVKEYVIFQSFEKPQVHAKEEEEVYDVAWKRGLSDTGILISGCQSDETSADHSPSGGKSEAYGALSNAIQTIIAESNGRVSNRELVRKARVMLKKQGFKQRPGLYCTDHHADASFVC